MATSIQQNLVEKNKAYAANFKDGELALPPAKKYLVVSCMDARIHAPSAFGIDLGDAHIIQNAGAIAKDALRSIVISEQLLGTTEVILVKHTGCGMLTFENKDIHGVIQKNLGQDASSIDFHPFPDLEQAVKDDVKFLQDSPLVPDTIKISGWVYDVKTALVKQIV